MNLLDFISAEGRQTSGERVDLVFFKKRRIDRSRVLSVKTLKWGEISREVIQNRATAPILDLGIRRKP